MARVPNVGGTTSQSFRHAAKQIAKGARALKKAGLEGIYLIGEEIMTDVKASAPEHGVPVDQGHLRASGRVTREGEQAVLLSFGDSAVDYALIQHETMWYHHHVGEPRYLVRGIERWKPGGSAAMASLARMADEAIKAAGQSP